MKRLFMVSWVVIFCCSDAHAQTNELRAARLLYDVPLPKVRLASMAPELSTGVVSIERARAELPVRSAERVETAKASTNGLNASIEHHDFGRPEQEFLQLYHRLDGLGYFERAEAPSDSPFIRWAEGTFRPEVVHLGKTTMTCSLLTAIKRRNPFCLINPVVFQLSW